ncbi:EVE domain-containing protein [Geotalea uraniireducens]|uniref:EVE domain-containing protein n=1 Tax=Geotalea uraniireducens TaxID=351604 RepID=UPI002491E0F6|nr:EVE domain-containing protein [Geotalea uraniireducens]
MPRDRRYWLFKSEPSCFSFADLQSRPDGTEHWDGVRNFQARNFLRDEIAVGDGVLFYHSNIAEPAVVGLAEVVRGGYPDWTAFDPAAEHFDPQSRREEPRWYMVDVRYVRPLLRPVTLAEMKLHPALAGMALLHRSRLSVQPVTGAEWTYILQLGGVAG